MKLEQSFEVAAPVERVWKTLLDVERVAPCLPGAAVTGIGEDGSYDGTFAMKIGPTTARYTGKLKMEAVDESSHTATMQANGTDRRGQGGARATIVSTVHSGGGDLTRVDVVTDYHITGRLARFGRGGMIEDISERLLTEFAQRLQASLAADGGEASGPAAETAEQTDTPAEAQAETQPNLETRTSAPPPSDPMSHGSPVEPLQANSLVASVLLDRARRNPAGAASLVVGLLVALAIIWRRR